jgi:hypothetical protein
LLKESVGLVDSLSGDIILAIFCGSSRRERTQIDRAEASGLDLNNWLFGVERIEIL